MKRRLKTYSLAFITLLTAACSAAGEKQSDDSKPTPQIPLYAPVPAFHSEENPKTLLEWGVLVSNGAALNLAQDSFVYDLQTPLFSDYALKLRTITMPHGAETQLDTDNDRIIFPVGTIITKTFYYPKGDSNGQVKKSDIAPVVRHGTFDISDYKLIETRLLVRRDHGWDALPYVWNEDQTQAKLSRTGDIKKLSMKDGKEFAYVVPNVNQCAGCHATNHTTKKIVPIGPRLRHLTSTNGMRLTAKPETFAQNVVWNDAAQPLNARARAYLDINCSHCHNKVGPADTSGLHLEPTTPAGQTLGYCKPPIAAGTGTGNRKHGIVPGKPEESIFTYRMASTNPAEMMPELGRSLAHEEGVALIRAWIASLEGRCDG